MSLDVPDIIVEFQSDDDELSDEAENFYTQCDRLCERVAGYPVVQESECKKDNRPWLYKNKKLPERLNDELTYDQVFSVMGFNGRRFKKDSRLWLHKTTEKALKLKELERIAQMKHREKNTNCKFTSSYDDTGLDENSLTAMSNITICSDPRCQNLNACSKRSHEMLNQDNMAGSGCRNRKRRKVNHSAPPSPAQFSNFAIVSRSVDSEIGFANRFNSRDTLDLNSDDSNDAYGCHQRSWKNERSPQRWQEFRIMSSATPVTSGGSINLADSSPEVKPRDECLHVQYSPKRKVSVYDIVNEDFYDFFKSPDTPWSNSMDDSEVQLNKR